MESMRLKGLKNVGTQQMVKKAFNFLILLLIERKYRTYYYLSVRICKFLFLFVEDCVGTILAPKSCIGTLALGIVSSRCRDCIQDVIFGTCLADALCDSGLFDSITEYFDEKIRETTGDFVADLMSALTKRFIGECK